MMSAKVFASSLTPLQSPQSTGTDDAAGRGNWRSAPTTAVTFGSHQRMRTTTFAPPLDRTAPRHRACQSQGAAPNREALGVLLLGCIQSHAPGSSTRLAAPQRKACCFQRPWTSSPLLHLSESSNNPALAFSTAPVELRSQNSAMWHHTKAGNKAPRLVTSRGVHACWAVRVGVLGSKARCLPLHGVAKAPAGPMPQRGLLWPWPRQPRRRRPSGAEAPNAHGAEVVNETEVPVGAVAKTAALRLVIFGAAATLW
mmetsp:Transcript_48424/g.139073  ORF Transcript_48424/g.139073 Transcript_48424/m.139073 type:complete len:255 (-) Transcript_48424:26-790(-)